MKRKALVALFVIVAVTLLAGTLLLTKGVKAVNVKINKKDFPNQGIVIISPSDPTFDELMADLVKRRPGFPAEEFKPFSIFIKNTGKHSIVAYKLRWECMKEDGTVIYKDSSFSAAWTLMNSGPDHEQAIAQATTIIRPNSIWFISLNSDPLSIYGPATKSDFSNQGHSVINSAELEQNQQLLQNSEKIADLRRANASELAKYTNITIRLDGIFFDDGSFVGQDTSGFFDAVKAEVDSNQDFLREIQNGLQQGKSATEVSKQVESLTVAPAVNLDTNSTYADYYNYYKRGLAEEYLRYKEALGDDKASKHALKKLDKPWAKLLKLRNQ
ncbi:MAG TPA: hypothetical protein VGN95_19030 [Pyrinomonadaceae bacterium]|jgi:hypothetical protein|nr:hypothetical protein [Pyrinomonadaceae bacterium]